MPTLISPAPARSIRAYPLGRRLMCPTSDAPGGARTLAARLGSNSRRRRVLLCTRILPSRWQQRRTVANLIVGSDDDHGPSYHSLRLQRQPYTCQRPEGCLPRALRAGVDEVRHFPSFSVGHLRSRTLEASPEWTSARLDGTQPRPPNDNETLGKEARSHLSTLVDYRVRKAIHHLCGGELL